MPELPEVEIVKRNIEELLLSGNRIESWLFKRSDLRFVIPRRGLQQLKGKKISRVERRAKYLLFFVEERVILSHLGMTGQWRIEENGTGSKQKHDHVILQLSGGKRLVFCDPRRFGFIELLSVDGLSQRLSGLGPEPLSKDLNRQSLTETFSRLQSPVKVALMNQKNLVGVGNIYASEALFRAQISPLKKCSKVKEKEYDRLWGQVVDVLQAAIQSGGSTIDSYRNSRSEAGRFQNELLVYGRDGEECVKCHSVIVSIFLGGRNTFWCPSCQKRS